MRSIVTVVAALIALGSVAFAADRVAPKIVDAQMVDQDGNGRADRVRITFSEPVTAACEKPERMRSWLVDGYKHTGVTPVIQKKSITVLLDEKAREDGDARPSIFYNRSGCLVMDAAGNEAKRQEFADTKPFDKEDANKRTVVATAQYTGALAGNRLECALATLYADSVSIVGNVAVTSKKSCRVTFDKVPLGDVEISVTGTWYPLTPVGGCKKTTITATSGVVTVNVTPSGFGGCLLR